MDRIRQARLGYASLAFALLALVPTSLFAQEHPIDAFTNEVGILIRLKEPDQTLEKVINLVNKVQPGAGSALGDQQKVLLGQVIANPTLTGVDLSRDWYAGVYFEQDGPPVVVYAIPAVNTDDLVSALEDLTTEVKGNWVVYTDSEVIPEADSAENAVSLLGTKRVAELQSGDMNFYINIALLAGVYEQQLGLFEEQVLSQVGQLRYAPGQDEDTLEAIVELYSGMIENAFSSLGESDSSIWSIKLSETEIAIDQTLTVTEGTDTATKLQSLKTDPLQRLAKLPAGSLGYFGVGGISDEMMKWGLKFTSSALKDDDAKKLFEESTALMEEVELGASVGAFDLEDSASAVLRMALYYEGSPIEKLKQISRNGIAAMKEVDQQGITQRFTLKENAENIDGHDVDVTSVEIEFNGDKETDPFQIQQKMMNVLYGTDGYEMRSTWFDDGYLLTAGGGEKAARAALKGLTASKENETAQARKGMMAQANFMSFIDLARTGGKALKIASKIPDLKLPINAQMVDSLNLKPTYVAFAAGVEENTLKTEFRLPVEQIVGLTKIGVLVGTSTRGGF